MKLVPVLVVCCVILCNFATSYDLEAAWAEFKAKYKKPYLTDVYEAYRKEVFRQNLEKIEAHNKKFDAGLVTYTIGVNRFADLTPEEFREMYLHKLG